MLGKENEVLQTEARYMQYATPHATTFDLPYFPASPSSSNAQRRHFCLQTYSVAAGDCTYVQRCNQAVPALLFVTCLEITFGVGRALCMRVSVIECLIQLKLRRISAVDRRTVFPHLC